MKQLTFASRKKFIKQYREVLAHGLDSEYSYVILDHQPELGIHLAARVGIHRPHPYALTITFKLRAAINDMLNPDNPPTPDVEDVDVVTLHPTNKEADQIKMFRTEYPLEWMKGNKVRVSTVGACELFVPYYNGASFTRTPEPVDDVIWDFIRKIELTIGRELNGAPEYTREYCMEALAISLRSDAATKFHPDRIVFATLADKIDGYSLGPMDKPDPPKGDGGGADILQFDPTG